eukprot:gene7017-biopygen10952
MNSPFSTVAKAAGSWALCLALRHLPSGCVGAGALGTGREGESAGMITPSVDVVGVSSAAKPHLALPWALGIGVGGISHCPGHEAIGVGRAPLTPLTRCCRAIGWVAAARRAFPAAAPAMRGRRSSAAAARGSAEGPGPAVSDRRGFRLPGRKAQFPDMISLKWLAGSAGAGPPAGGPPRRRRGPLRDRRPLALESRRRRVVHLKADEQSPARVRRRRVRGRAARPQAGAARDGRGGGAAAEGRPPPPRHGHGRLRRAAAAQFRTSRRNAVVAGVRSQERGLCRHRRRRRIALRPSTCTGHPGIHIPTSSDVFPTLQVLVSGAVLAARRFPVQWAEAYLCAFAAAMMWTDFMDFGATGVWCVVIAVTDCMLMMRCRRRPAAAVVAATLAYSNKDLSTDARVSELASFQRDLFSFPMRLCAGGHRRVGLKKARVTPVQAQCPPLEHRIQARGNDLLLYLTLKWREDGSAWAVRRALGETKSARWVECYAVINTEYNVFYRCLVTCAVFIIDFALTRRFVDRMENEKARVAASTVTAERVAASLASYDLTLADELVDAAGDELPTDLRAALRALLGNLHMYSSVACNPLHLSRRAKINWGFARSEPFEILGRPEARIWVLMATPFFVPNSALDN